MFFNTSNLKLTDSFGRNFNYLRLSITDECNFRCTYCLPNGYQKTVREFLSVSEIRRLVQAFSELGMWKVRLTGGEPTLRRDLFEIISAIKEVKSVRKIALSTNGYRLKEIAKDLHRLGVTSLNVSLDHLDRDKFNTTTGTKQFDAVLSGIESALNCGFDSVKTNAVLMKNQNLAEIEKFIDWTKNVPIDVRFIELMQTKLNGEMFSNEHVSAEVLRKILISRNWFSQKRELAAGPAEVWKHPLHTGTIGLIAPYGKDFCTNCNRLRVTATGDLRLCLFGEGGHSLREYLQSDDLKENLKMHVSALLGLKRESHYLQNQDVGDMRTFSSTGG